MSEQRIGTRDPSPTSRDFAAKYPGVDFHAMVEAATIGITEVEPGTGRVFYANEAFHRLTGYSREDFANGMISFVELTHPDDRAANVALHKEFLKGGLTRYCLKKRYLRKDGSIVHVRVTASNLRRLKNGSWRSIGIVEDLSGEQARHSSSHPIASAVEEPNASRLAKGTVKIVEELTRTNPDRTLDVASVARVAGLSQRVLYGRFKVLGLKPAQYVKRIRLERARSQLQAGSRETTVTAVAVSNGFSNLGHFASDYRRAFGERPSDTLARARALKLNARIIANA